MDTIWTAIFFILGIGAGWLTVRLSYWMLEPNLRPSGRAPLLLRTPWIQLILGTLWALSAAYHQHLAQALAWCLFWVYLLTAMGTDLLAMRVPNRMTRPAAVIFWLLAMAAGIQGAVGSTVGLIGMWAIVFSLAVITGGRGMGYGDVRLYGTIGAMLGVGYGVFSLVVAAVSASVIGLCLRAAGRLSKNTPIPFVPHIVVGCVTAVFFGSQLIHWYLRTILG